MRDGFGEIIEKLRRATVAIRTRRNRGGSGVVWSGDGVIVTNAHVVEGAGEAAEVEFWDGRRVDGKIEQKDRRRDLAALRVPASGVPAVAAGDSDALRTGELVIAVGNPLGFIGAASTGVVHSMENRSWVISQLRLAPGNSGGPLANARGEVVGINTMIAGGLAFAVPTRSVARFLSQDVSVDQRLGVVVRPAPYGLLILEVKPGSPADRASLLLGDILVEAIPRNLPQNNGSILELHFRRGGSANIRTVVVPMAAAARAA